MNQEERRAAKEAKRAANRAAWTRDPRNANFQREETLAAIVPEIIEPITEQPGSASLSKMRAIMGDPGTPLYRRLDAAECVLSYELGPGAAVGLDPDQIAAGSFRFLKAVSEAPETPEPLRFRALKSIVAVENARAAVKANAGSHAVKRELLVNLVNAERRRALMAAQRWPLHSDAEWAISVADDFEWPDGWPGTWQWPPADIAARLDRANQLPKAELSARNEAFGAKLRAVRARNRVDGWEELLGSEAA